MIGIVLFINASSFDETEIRSLLQIATVLAGLFGAQHWASKKKDKDETE
jgi:hypothetical protein